MSHTVQIKTEVRDLAAIKAACVRLGLSPPVEGQHKLFSETISGVGVKLPGWRYPAILDLATGSVRFDTFGERWGKTSELERFKQAYTVEKAKLEARKKGHAFTEQQLSDGSIKLTIRVGNGGAA